MGNAFNFTHTSELATEELRESLNILKIIMSQQASENNLQYKINLHEKIILNLWKHIDNNKDKMNESQILDPLESIETHLHESQASLLQISSITRWHSDDIIYLTNSIKEIISSQNKELAAIKKWIPPENYYYEVE